MPHTEQVTRIPIDYFTVPMGQCFGLSEAGFFCSGHQKGEIKLLPRLCSHLRSGSLQSPFRCWKNLDFCSLKPKAPFFFQAVGWEPHLPFICFTQALAMCSSHNTAPYFIKVSKDICFSRLKDRVLYNIIITRISRYYCELCMDKLDILEI